MGEQKQLALMAVQAAVEACRVRIWFFAVNAKSALTPCQFMSILWAYRLGELLNHCFSEIIMSNTDSKPTDDLVIPRGENIVLSAEAFDRLEQQLEENPMSANEPLKALMARETRWS